MSFSIASIVSTGTLGPWAVDEEHSTRVFLSALGVSMTRMLGAGKGGERVVRWYLQMTMGWEIRVGNSE